MFPTILSSSALVIALIAAAIAYRAHQYSRDCYEYVRRVSKMRPEFDELATLSSELTQQKDALSQISKGLRTIRNRMNVRETNAKRKVDRESADQDDDEAWLKRTNAMLQRGATGVTEK